MRPFERWSRVAFLATVLLATRPLSAQSTHPLAAAEKAYAEVDFEKTHELALSALRRGGNEPDETKRLYTLLAISAAALDASDEAREAFRRVLAIDPTTRLDQSLSPRLRAPYLEARGELGSAGDARPLEVTLERSGRSFELELQDRATVARTLELSIETEGRAPDQRRFPADPHVALPAGLSLPSRFTYTLTALDEYGNRLFRTTREMATAAPDGSPEATSETPGAASDTPLLRGPNRTPYYVTAGVLAGLGLGAIAGGAIAQVRREDAAKEWNSSSCETPGQSRGQQCADVDADRRSAEHWAIGLYAAGGTLLIGSLITLAILPDSKPERPRALACLPSLDLGGQLGATCRTSF